MRKANPSMMEKIGHILSAAKAKLLLRNQSEGMSAKELEEQYLRSLPKRLRTTGFSLLSRTYFRTQKRRLDTSNGERTRRLRQIEKGQLRPDNGLVLTRKAA